jgi:predicted phosphodiesterase
MKIQLLSDLHLEAHPHFQATPAPGADVLVLAGDIGSYQLRKDGTRFTEPDWGLRRFSPLPEHAGWPTPVLFVPGNHEYDGQDVDQTRAAMKAACAALGIRWLDHESCVIDGVRWVGTTLWTDFDALAGSDYRGNGVPPEPLARRMRLRQKAFKAANHYLATTGTTRNGRAFDAEAVREEALACQAWLAQVLAQPFDGPTVVVTHFAPSLRSADPRYGVTPGTAGFCNGLEPLMEGVDLWLHGHLHCPLRYRVGACTVVANPLGYASKQEQLGFEPQCLITLPSTSHSDKKPSAGGH